VEYENNKYGTQSYEQQENQQLHVCPHVSNPKWLTNNEQPIQDEYVAGFSECSDLKFNYFCVLLNLNESIF